MSSDPIKVFCVHRWGTKCEFRDGDKTRTGMWCRYCDAIWYEGDEIPSVVIGEVRRG